MELSDHDLSQLDEEALLDLPEDVLRRLSIELLNDLKEARERLNQNSRNSSCPPSSDPPWEKDAIPSDAIDDTKDTEEEQSANDADEKASNSTK